MNTRLLRNNWGSGRERDGRRTARVSRADRSQPAPVKRIDAFSRGDEKNKSKEIILQVRVY